jgi:ABC-type bacteriocin/lantibiotic exporter with double-glycine peptidase domain
VISLHGKDFFQIFKEFPEYNASLFRINNFLALPEKNDNLSGSIITSKINSIVFKNVYFKYSEKTNKAIKNYDDDFTKKNVSYLLGESDKDKNTILYFKYATGEN